MRMLLYFSSERLNTVRDVMDCWLNTVRDVMSTVRDVMDCWLSTVRQDCKFVPCDKVRKICRGLPYPQTLTSCQGTRVSVIPFTPRNKVIFCCADFHENPIACWHYV